MAVKCTPSMMILWVANIILKGIATLSDFSLDLDERKVYVVATLEGESEPIEVWLEGFAVITDDYGNYIRLEQGQSNRVWLNTIFARIAGKPWKIPSIPQFQAYIDLVVELLKAETTEQEALEDQDQLRE